MASIRIHEDQENTGVTENRRLGKENIQQPKRNVLGVIDNKPLIIQNKQNQAKTQYIPLKENDKGAYQQKNTKLPNATIHVPVAQFEAFNVYEDQKENTSNANVVESKKEIKEIIIQKKLEHEISLEEAARRLPIQEKDNKNILSMSTDVIISESPMSVDRSIGKIISFEQNIRKEVDILFDLCEYRDDIYKYMRDCEFKHRPKAGYMKKQPDINAAMRTVLVDWLVEVGDEYKLQTETLFLAVSYIDRFLSFMAVVRAKLQLVGTAAMFIASKYEEIYPPDVNEFVYITDDTYSKKQLLRMEHLILKVLSFDLSAPTTLSFVKHFCISQNVNEKIMFLATYFVELSLLEVDPYLQYLPSQIASSAIALARHTLDEELWPAEYEKASGYTLRYLKPCMQNLQQLFKIAPTLTQQAIQEKYKNDSRLQVSLIPPRDFPPDFF